ncbi:MAG: 3'-5' exonuclease domain-containing protein 2 [Muribaculaceae bacterium]|nr:3'-5' exonuclease domain-containing protein 2 [Muribaculaceae bacterium]
MNISISKQQLATLPPAHFTGSIVVVDTAADVDGAVKQLRDADLIGFDTETRPSFKKGQNYNVSLLQLSSTDVCFLFRLNKIGLPEPLKELLEDKDKIKVGLSIHDDFRNLHKTYSFEPRGFIELQTFVTRWNIIDKSLSKLYGILFGQRLSKSQRLSNWESEILADSQQHYAALDANACIQIYRQLNEGLFNPDSSPYKVREEDEAILNK